MCNELSLISRRKASSRNRREVLLALAAFLAASTPFVALAGIELNGKLRNAAPVLIEAIQRRLTELGFSPGPVNGRWNSQTQIAFAEFCRQRRLPPTDRLAREHIRAMWDEDFDLNDGAATIRFLRRIGVNL
jgi:putative peptidoglycan binding protein